MKTWYLLLSLTLVSSVALAASAILPPMQPNPEHFESRSQTSRDVVSPTVTHHPRPGRFKAETQSSPSGEQGRVAAHQSSEESDRIDADDLIGK